MKFFYVVLLLLFFSCSAQDAMPVIGEKFKGPFDPDPAFISYTYGKTAKVHFIENTGVQYMVGVQLVSGEVVYMGSIDEDFKTPEGFSLSSTCLDIINHTGKSFVKEAGWGWYLPLASGWNACVRLSTETDDGRPPLNAPIEWYCKR